MPISPDKSL